MFRIVHEPTFTHTVPVMTPVDGGHREEKIEVTYRIINADEAAGYPETEEGNADFLRRVVLRVDDIADEDGAPLPWSDELRDRLIALPHVRIALARGYGAALAKGRAGN